MLRDQFQVTLRNLDGAAISVTSAQPALILRFEGSQTQLREVLTERFRDSITAEEIEVSFRYLSPSDEEDEGVLGLTDCVTGAYIIEVETAVETIRTFVQDVRDYADRSGQEVRYRVAIRTDGETIAEFDKGLLLVYGANGTLLRHASLIPTDIEM